MSRYRRMRGMAIHVVPYLRDNPMASPRAILPSGFFKNRRKAGICAWCRLPIENPGRRYWDAECDHQRWAVLGAQIRPNTVLHPYACAWCGLVPSRNSRPLQIDHLYPIHEGVANGVKGIVRAFLWENYRYLCASCHGRKSAMEAGLRAAQRREELAVIRERGIQASVPVAPPPTTMFDLAQYESRKRDDEKAGFDPARD